MTRWELQTNEIALERTGDKSRPIAGSRQVVVVGEVREDGDGSGNAARFTRPAEGANKTQEVRRGGEAAEEAGGQAEGGGRGPGLELASLLLVPFGRLLVALARSLAALLRQLLSGPPDGELNR